jgi:hypothetical protein
MRNEGVDGVQHKSTLKSKVALAGLHKRLNCQTVAAVWLSIKKGMLLRLSCTRFVNSSRLCLC